MSIHHTARNRAYAVSLIAALALSGGLLTGCSAASGNASAEAPPAAMAPAMAVHSTAPGAQIALYSGMRTLWDQHMQWTYDTVVAFAADSPGLQPTIDRILSNQVDIGNAIAPYYGDAAATQLTDLLTTHITEAVPVLTAAKAGDTPALNKAVQAWYANAQDIADFLAKANPNWKQGDLRNMMKSHITQTIEYASDVLTGNYAKAISDYDTAQAHMDQMADMLSEGIIAQFPDKF
jgi:malate synthase